MQRVSSWTRRRCGRLPGRAPSGCCCFSGQLLSVPVLWDECAAFVCAARGLGAACAAAAQLTARHPLPAAPPLPQTRKRSSRSAQQQQQQPWCSPRRSA